MHNCLRTPSSFSRTGIRRLGNQEGNPGITESRMKVKTASPIKSPDEKQTCLAYVLTGTSAWRTSHLLNFSPFLLLWFESEMPLVGHAFERLVSSCLALLDPPGSEGWLLETDSNKRPLKVTSVSCFDLRPPNPGPHCENVTCYPPPTTASSPRWGKGLKAFRNSDAK